MKTDHAAVGPRKQQHAIRQVDRQVGWVIVTKTAIQLLDHCRPPVTVHASEDDAATALQKRPFGGRDSDRDRVMHSRCTESDVVGTRARLVKLRPHCSILKLEWNTRIELREDSARASG